jgi:hypothetical protein
MTSGLRFRDSRDGDFGFVLDTWRRSFEGAPAVRGSDVEHYRAEMKATITKLLRSPAVRVTVAHPEGDEDAIVGYAVHNGAELHYVYVRGGEPSVSMRGLGIAKQLIEPLSIAAYTFRTEAGERRLKPKDRGWRFTPRFTL